MANLLRMCGTVACDAFRILVPRAMLQIRSTWGQARFGDEYFASVHTIAPFLKRKQRNWVVDMCYPPVSVLGEVLSRKIELGIKKRNEGFVSDARLTKGGDLRFPAARFEFE